MRARQRRLRSWLKHEQQERRNGSGRVHAPRLKLPDEGQSQGGGGVRDGTEDSTSGRAAGPPAGARAAEERPHRAALLRGQPADPRPALWQGRQERLSLRYPTAAPLQAKRKEEEQQEKVMEELDLLCRISVAQLTSIQRQRMAEHRRSGLACLRQGKEEEDEEEEEEEDSKNFFLSRSSHSKIWTLFNGLFRSSRLVRLLWRCHEFGVWIVLAAGLMWLRWLHLFGQGGEHARCCRQCWLVLLVTIHHVLCFLRVSMFLAIPQVQFLYKVICPSLLRQVPFVR